VARPSNPELEERMRHLVLTTGILAACSGGDGAGDGGPTTPADRFGELVNATEEVAGDFGCFTPGEEPTWLAQAADPTKQAPFPIHGLVQDFEDETPVGGATVALYADDTVDTPDSSQAADVNGDVSVSGPSCTPVTYRVTSEGGPIATKTTFKAHQIYPFPTGDAIDGAVFTSVSDVTYQLIPGILGVEVQPDLAIIAGTAFDCSRDPSASPDDDAGKLEGVQIVVYDADGNIPDTLTVNYFIENFPARDQEATSADGLWVAANVPPGTLTVEMWGVVGGELVKLGASQLESEADSINIANVYAGYGDGVKYPASCVLP
jgi:hypothetical protein